MCLCVGCMCIVMGQGMCEKSNRVRHASDGLVGGDRGYDRERDVVDCEHSIEHSHTRYLRLYEAI